MTLWKEIVFLLGILLFRLTLDISYLNVIAPVFSHMGFTVDIVPLKLLESYLLTVLLALTLRPEVRKPSHVLIIVFFLATIVPTLSLYGLRSESRLFTYMMIVGYLIAALIPRVLPRLRIHSLRQGQILGLTTCLAVVLSVLAWLVARGGLTYFNLDLLKVYEYRRTVGTLVNIGVMAYINTWAFKVLNPALIAWSIWRRNIMLFLLFGAIQVVYFGVLAHKSILFFPLLIVGIYIVFRFKNPVLLMLAGLIGVVGASAIVAGVWNYILPASLFIRRVFYVPADLNFAYYEIFSRIGYVLRLLQTGQPRKIGDLS